VGMCVRILAHVVDEGCHLLSMSAANALFVHPFVRVYKQSVLQVCVCVRLHVCGYVCTHLGTCG